jgi:phosphatidylinositol alpha-mannosyltransferase
MRIGLVCPYSLTRSGGVQTHVLGLAGWLKAAGHRVSVLAPDAASAPLRLKFFGLNRFDVADAGRSVDISYNGSVAPINFGVGPGMRARVWARRGFDVIHVHEPEVPGISLLATWASQVPVVATFHTNARDSALTQAAISAIPELPEKLAATIAVSPVAARVAKRRLGVSPMVIPNGIQIAEPAESLIKQKHDPLAVFVGRFDEPRKGFDTLLAAMPLILKEIPEFRLIVIGEGHQVDAAGVDYTGEMIDEWRDEWLATADVLIAPSLGAESFGIVLVEALAQGAAVVASAIPGYQSVLGPNGNLFKPGSPQELARTVVDVLRHPIDRQANRTAALKFGWPTVAPEILRIYEACARIS